MDSIGSFESRKPLKFVTLCLHARRITHLIIAASQLHFLATDENAELADHK